MIVTQGSTNVTVPFYFVDDVGGTNPGEPTTGLLFSDIETGGSASYQRQGAARVDLTLITLASASAAHADGGFILVDDTEMPGVYRCDIPDAAVASGVDFVIINLRAASGKNTLTRPLKIDLTTMDFRDGVRGGLTALPNAAADAPLGLPISDAGGLDLDAIKAVTDALPNAGALNDLAAILTDTAVIGALGAGLTNIPWNSSWDTEVQSEVNDALVVLQLDHLLHIADASTTTDNSIIAKMVSKSATAAFSSFVNTTDSLEAVRDRGDSAWVTAPNDLDAAGIRSAVGLTSANLDTQLADIPTVSEFDARTLVATSYFDPTADTVANVTTVGSVTTKTGYALSATGLNLVLIDGKTLPVATQIIAAACIGIVSGAGSGTEVFKGLDKTTTRATVTVDASGNRSAITYV